MILYGRHSSRVARVAPLTYYYLRGELYWVRCCDIGVDCLPSSVVKVDHLAHLHHYFCVVLLCHTPAQCKVVYSVIPVASKVERTLYQHFFPGVRVCACRYVVYFPRKSSICMLRYNSAASFFTSVVVCTLKSIFARRKNGVWMSRRSQQFPCVGVTDACICSRLLDTKVCIYCFLRHIVNSVLDMSNCCCCFLWKLRSRAQGARGARAGAVRMSGLPADFDPLSPSMDHLSMIDEASKQRSQPRVGFCAVCCSILFVVIS